MRASTRVMSPADALAELASRVSFADEATGRNVRAVLVGVGHLIDALTDNLIELRDELGAVRGELVDVRRQLDALKPAPAPSAYERDVAGRLPLAPDAKPAAKTKAKGD